LALCLTVGMADRATNDPVPIHGQPLEPLWRQVLGWKLRELRLARGRKLTEIAGRAGISPQYLSEIERGLKEPSSEMIAAIAGALGLTLLDLTGQLNDDLRSIRDGREPYVSGDRSESGGVPLAPEVLAFAA
jgi:transcriptional regulator with XRE-family HTH domain